MNDIQVLTKLHVEELKDKGFQFKEPEGDEFYWTLSYGDDSIYAFVKEDEDGIEYIDFFGDGYLPNRYKVLELIYNNIDGVKMVDEDGMAEIYNCTDENEVDALVDKLSEDFKDYIFRTI